MVTMQTEGVFLLLFTVLFPGLGEDTVAEDVGRHQIGRLVEMLTARECQDLLSTLSQPEEHIFQRLERLSLERNQLGFVPLRARRATGREARCRAALTEWLAEHGPQTYFDRLSRGLQLVGRTDIAKELGKNINQDKLLGLQRYLEDYHRHVDAMQSSLVQADTEQQRHGARQPVRQVRDLTWSDLELVVERDPQPPYSRPLLDRAWPLVYGILLGFIGSLLAGALVLLFLLHVARADMQKLLRLSCRQGRVRVMVRRPSRPAQGHPTGDAMTSSSSDQDTHVTGTVRRKATRREPRGSPAF